MLRSNWSHSATLVPQCLPPACLPVCLSTQPACMSARPSVYTAYLHVCLHVCISVCLSACLSVCPSAILQSTQYQVLSYPSKNKASSLSADQNYSAQITLMKYGSPLAREISILMAHQAQLSQIMKIHFHQLTDVQRPGWGGSQQIGSIQKHVIVHFGVINYGYREITPKH